MGYTTEFFGKFIIDRALDDDTFRLMRGLENTRRMKRNVDSKYGIEGEFYVDGKGFMGQDFDDPTILDFNHPPKTQPGLWCHWSVLDDRKTIEWNGGEKFYYYVEWLEYLIKSVLSPKGYIVNGRVSWEGEERDDVGVIHVTDNKVTVTLN